TLPMLQPRSSEVKFILSSYQCQITVWEIDGPKKSQVKLEGQIKLIHVQGDLTTLKCHIKAHNQESQSMNN
nr:hypothetical protein [Tanacetum cinerariifolium]